jgi:sucrose-phosphate synthase
MIKKEWLIVCDIDGTLLLPGSGNPGLEEFSRFIEDHRDTVVFVLNSGRSLDEIAQVAECGPIPRPDWMVCSVGTELYSGFTPDTADRGWEGIMARDWPREEIRRALAGCPGIIEQEAWLQHAAKLSYYFEAPVADVHPEIIRRTGSWQENFKKIVCFDHYLDFLPSWGGKGASIKYLADKYEIDADHIVTAGHSVHDRDMLDRGYASILVSNHAADLADLVGKEGVFLSSRPAASGVLEGLAFFGVR